MPARVLNGMSGPDRKRRLAYSQQSSKDLVGDHCTSQGNPRYYTSYQPSRLKNISTPAEIRKPHGSPQSVISSHSYHQYLRSDPDILHVPNTILWFAKYVDRSQLAGDKNAEGSLQPAGLGLKLRRSVGIAFR